MGLASHIRSKLAKVSVRISTLTPTSVTRTTGTLANNKRKSRVAALQVLYELDSSEHNLETVLSTYPEDIELPKTVRSFSRNLVSGVLAHREEIDKIIETFAPSWPVHQIATVDRNILRVAIYEIRFGGQTPPKVAVNEAVEIAKIFGADGAPKFVNGVLGSVMKEIGETL